jgi:hypothetical protein
MPVNKAISSTKKLYGVKNPITGSTKCGSKIWPYAVKRVPESETKPIITNQCAIPDPVKFNIFECRRISLSALSSRFDLF